MNSMAANANADRKGGGRVITLFTRHGARQATRTAAGLSLPPPPAGRAHPFRGTGTAPRRAYTPTRVVTHAGIRAIHERRADVN